MKSKLASLILFASILSSANLQAFKTTGFELAHESNKDGNFASFNRSINRHHATISQPGWR